MYTIVYKVTEEGMGDRVRL